jgi:ribonucleoside-diphosphate reductase alpha chain
MNELQQVSKDVLLEKYAKGTEKTEDDIFKRVAKGIASVEKTPALRKLWEGIFYENMKAGAIGAGRIMSAAGTDIQATLNNCYVLPVGDCIQGNDDEGYPGIYEALKQAAETMRRGGGVGYDFSRIRPKNAYVKGTHSFASGPCSYMDVFDKSCATVESAGSRRGAQMGVLRIDHPDIMEFITAKRIVGRWNNFNVSVMVSDAFMKAVENDSEWELVHKAKPSISLTETMTHRVHQRSEDGLWVYNVVKAKELWDAIMKSAYDFAEPGILFHDNMNKDNNLRYVEQLNATNPCAEQPLPNYGCCDLGPIILTKLLKGSFTKFAKFDFDELKKLTATHVRFLDNVLDATYWPLPEQDQESKNKRRIGIEFTGLGDVLIMLGLKYNSNEGYAMGALIAETMRNSAYEASVELAKEKGAFPLFDAKKYLEKGTFASRLPQEIKKKITKFGIRNSHLLSTGPTGTVSLAFGDNCSNGIEPAFSWSYTRKKRNGDGTHTEYEVTDHAYRMYKELGNDVTKLPEYFVSAMDMSASDHIKMLEVVQPFVDSSISKTVNVPVDYPFEDFKCMYMQAWKANLKGLATYRPNSIIGSVLSIKEEPNPNSDKPVNTDIDYNKVVIEKRPVGMLDSVSEKIEYWSTEGKKSVYMSVSFMPIFNEDNQVACVRPIEFFIPVGQHGESQQWLQTCMRMLSLAARGGFLDKALADMRKVAWDRGPIRHGFKSKEDGTKVPLYHDSEVAVLAWAIQNIIDTKTGVASTEVSSEINEVQMQPPTSGKKCPECGAHSVIKKDGCSFCEACGAIGSCG